MQSEFSRGTEFIIELPDKIIDNDFIPKNEENTFNAERNTCRVFRYLCLNCYIKILFCGKIKMITTII